MTLIVYMFFKFVKLSYSKVGMKLENITGTRVLYPCTSFPSIYEPIKCPMSHVIHFKPLELVMCRHSLMKDLKSLLQYFSYIVTKSSSNFIIQACNMYNPVFEGQDSS